MGIAKSVTLADSHLIQWFSVEEGLFHQQTVTLTGVTISDADCTTNVWQRKKMGRSQRPRQSVSIARMFTKSLFKGPSPTKWGGLENVPMSTIIRSSKLLHVGCAWMGEKSLRSHAKSNHRDDNLTSMGDAAFSSDWETQQREAKPRRF